MATPNKYVMEDALLFLARSDPVIERISMSLPPLKGEFREPNFEGMVRIIINQQLSAPAVRTIFERLKGLMSKNLMTPENALQMEECRYLKCGVSRAKTDYIRELAKKFKAEPSFISLLQKLDPVTLHSEVRKLRGFGPWSASIFSIFYMQHPDVFVHGDVSIRRAIISLYGEQTVTDKQRINSHIKCWSPYNSVACMLMWHWIDNGMPN